MEKLKEIIKKSLENVYWVPSKGDYVYKSDYPSLFEQKYGNLHTASLCLRKYVINRNNIDNLYKFLKKWNFEGVEQYQLNEYTNANFFSDDMTLLITINIGDDSINKNDDEDEDGDAGNLVYTESTSTITFCPLQKNSAKISEFLFDLASQDLFYIPETENDFYMIAQSSRGLYKQKTSFKNIEIKDGRYDLYYGKNFPHEKIVKFFDDDSENFMLFYGLPGCGKTNYIKNLITYCDRDVIYIPPSMVNVISDPSFVSFILQNQGNVLIIEDAEQILSCERNAATQNLLGITDGFLKDSLKLKIIATMNADIKTIDPALLRRGRLYLSHNFDKLNVEDANELVKFCGIDYKIEEDMALCDIFNVDKFNSPLKNKETPIGFGNF